MLRCDSVDCLLIEAFLASGDTASNIITFRGQGGPISTTGDDVDTVTGSDTESAIIGGSPRGEAPKRRRTTSASSTCSATSADSRSAGRRPSGVGASRQADGSGPSGDGLSATPRAASRRQQRRLAANAGGQLDALLDLLREESRRDADARKEAAEREAASLAVQERAASTMDRVEGHMGHFATIMGEMIATMRGNRQPRE